MMSHHELGRLRRRRFHEQRLDGRCLNGRHPSGLTGGPAHRSGSVLVVVIGLLGLLMVVGFTFLTFSTQEQSNAEYFAESEKEYLDPGLDPDILFDFALQQLVLGADDTYPNSALYGGRHSLLPNMFGRDVHPFSGTGVHVEVDRTSNEPFTVTYVDQDFNRTADNNYLIEQIADTRVGNNGNTPFGSTDYPEPDTGVTYPDINNVFLAYRGYAQDPTGRPVFVVRPSFHPVQYLRNRLNGLPINDVNDTDDASAFNDANTQRLVFRPHRQHRSLTYNTSTATVQTSTGVRRFVGPGDPIIANPAIAINGAFPFGIGDAGAWNMDNWRPSTAYQVGDWVFPAGSNESALPATTPTRTTSGHNGFYYRCRQAGTSGGGEPGWSTTVGDDVNDGGVIWQVFAQPNYDFDTDPDGDGTREAVVLDLGFPLQETAGGTQSYVPLFSYTVYDADGLINLAATGNVDRSIFANLFGSTALANEFLSKSNQGVSNFEVNPQYVLNAGYGGAGDRPVGPTPAEFYEQHNRNLNLSGTNVVTDSTGWMYLSNAEWSWITSGRFQFDGTERSDRFTGRYGEPDRLQAAFDAGNANGFPKPGQTNVDDDNNSNVGERLTNQTVQNPTPLTAGGGTVLTYDTHPWQHPLDFLGIGQHYNFNTRRPDLVGSSPNRFPQFERYSSNLGTIGWILGLDGRPGGNDDGTLHSSLMVNPQAAALRDDPGETVVDSGSVPWAQYDQNFSAADALPLQLSQTDLLRSGASGRTRLFDLAPYNFRDSTRADQIRSGVTTSSYDLPLASRSIIPGDGSNVGAVTNRARLWENLPVAQGSTPLATPRPSTGSEIFPPSWYAATNVAFDPFRPALREVLRMQPGDQNAAFLRQGDSENGNQRFRAQRKLSLNHVAMWDATSKSVWFRELTPYPADPFAVTGPQRTSRLEQLRQARYDRQLMARDIYTMLYVFGGGDDDENPLTTANYYNERQLREMAQFAINHVAMIDPDHVIDRFEYDTDLTNGWGLDDNPYAESGFIMPAAVGHTSDVQGGDREVVNAVEEQLLTLSEALLIKADKVGTSDPGQDVPPTEYRDDEDRQFAFIELRNISPYRIPLDNRDSWRVILKRTDAIKRVLYVRNREVTAGGLFSIVTAGDAHNTNPLNPSETLPSFFKVDVDWVKGGGTAPVFDLIAPKVAFDVRDATAPGIDLINATPDADFAVYDDDAAGSDTKLNGAGEFFTDPVMVTDADVGAGSVTFDIILQRRSILDYDVPRDGMGSAKPNRVLLGENAEEVHNPWVEVDRMDNVPLQYFDIDENTHAGAGMGNTLLDKLQEVRSTHRTEALDRSGDGLDNVNTTTGINNSLGEENASDFYLRRQVHLNRPMISPVEMLSVPMYGPNEVTRLTVWHGAPLNGSGDPNSVSYRPGLAGPTKFLRPLSTANEGGGAGNPRLNNRWYRLFNFIDRPRSQPDRPNGSFALRDAGKINWNTLRNPEVLAGLIDDRSVFEIADFRPLFPDIADEDRYIRDRYDDGGGGTAVRDWWQQFIRSRDQFDTTSELYLPGTSLSRPFRNFDYVGAPIQSLEGLATPEGLESNGLEHTMLRSLPIDMENYDPRSKFSGTTRHSIARRRLFQMKTEKDLTTAMNGEDNFGPQGDPRDASAVDTHSQHRLLAKVLGNSTTRSNVFFVFIQVEFYEAVEVNEGGTPFVRIGKKLDDSPKYRSLFVVDRSRAFGKIKAEHFRPNTDNTPFVINDWEEWKELVIARLRIE